MKARLLSPALLLLFGLGLAQPTSARQVGLRLEGGHGRIELSFSSGGLRASASHRDRGHSRRHGRSYGHGSSRGRNDGRRYSDSHHVCVRRPIWVPGHYETRVRDVFVPPRHEKVWIEPVYEDAIDRYGGRTRVLVREGRWEVIETPGFYEPRTEQIWIPGRNEYRTTCRH